MAPRTTAFAGYMRWCQMRRKNRQWRSGPWSWCLPIDDARRGRRNELNGISVDTCGQLRGRGRQGVGGGYTFLSVK